MYEEVSQKISQNKQWNVMVIPSTGEEMMANML